MRRIRPKRKKVRRDLPARCNMIVRSLSAGDYPCHRIARRYGMCLHHASVMERKITRAGLLKRKVRSDKGIARTGDGG